MLRASILVLVALLVGACATTARTSLETSWIAPQAKGVKFKKILILSVASDEFAQQYFQEDMAAALKQRGVNAVASERFFTHRSPSEEARFRRAVEQSDADAVLLARVVRRDEKSGTTPGMLISPSGVPLTETLAFENVVAATFAPTLYVRPSDYTQVTVGVETLLFDLKTRRPVWSARTQTTNADQGDLKPAIAQFVSVVVGAMGRDGVF
jgi:hypothetical protein